jgi:hypothetical protein
VWCCVAAQPGSEGLGSGRGGSGRRDCRRRTVSGAGENVGERGTGVRGRDTLLCGYLGGGEVGRVVARDELLDRRGDRYLRRRGRRLRCFGKGGRRIRYFDRQFVLLVAEQPGKPASAHPLGGHDLRVRPVLGVHLGE